MKKTFSLGAVLFLSGCFMHKMSWGISLDKATFEDGWGTYKEFFYDKVHTPLDKETFMKRSEALTFEFITSQQFLDMNVQNCPRLEKYWNAKTAQEAYPEQDRQRGDKDISSVNYFLTTKEIISPVLIARTINKDGQEERIKLDGVHRIIAAHILEQYIKVAWIDLRWPLSLFQQY